MKRIYDGFILYRDKLKKNASLISELNRYLCINHLIVFKNDEQKYKT